MVAYLDKETGWYRHTDDLAVMLVKIDLIIDRLVAIECKLNRIIPDAEVIQIQEDK